MNTGRFVVVCVAVGAALGAAFHLGGRAAGGADAANDGRESVTPVATLAEAGAPLPTDRANVTVAGEGATPGSAGAGGVSTASSRADVTPSSVAPPLPALSYHDGIMRAAPSVVSVYAGLHERIAGGADGGGPLPRLSQGSGVIVDPDGIVLTNLHLVEDADAINVVLGDGTLHAGSLVGSDRETDLAVVRIDAAGIPEGGLPAIRLDDAPPLRVGDVVLAIGNPFGVGQTVTQGIVSATRRRVAGGSAWQDFVQIDAAINPGNSGGALINPAGQLVGVTTAVFRGLGEEGPDRGGRDTMPDTGLDAGAAIAMGIGFAIPADLLARVVPEIIADGRVVRGWLGIGADDLPMYPALHRRLDRGAVITGVLPDSPAAAGGLRAGDVVTAVDERDVDDATDLLLRVSSLGPGTPIRLRVDRESVTRELRVSLGERPSPGE